ncbi:arylsulfotransferase family protein [Albidovulum aquaemixtae]|uniref:arylsulfotransferase family protein n=1 Tax=Albidovulum aquaemixtae TaxID=1542388 RepID=UPI0015E81917|nr:arylsulfotransferase family protein [Defluviimonas aquaemixtae]
MELVDLSDFSTEFTWALDAGTLFEGLTPGPGYGAGSKITTDRFRAIHPLPFPNGDLLIKDHSSPAVRVSACGERIWGNPRIFHHSSEFGPEGDIWIPAIKIPASVPWSGGDLTDDSIVRLTPQGEIKEEYSVSRLLLENGYEWLLSGMGGEKDSDPIHMNDIQPVMTEGTAWRRGDLLVSIRHRSAVFLFRPSTGKILWLKTGPWVFQHDIDIVGDGQVVIFDNAMNPKLMPVPEGRFNRVLHVDLGSNAVEAYQPEAFAAAEIRTVHEGLADQMPDGRILVEEENFGRIIVLNADGSVAAEYINGADDGMVYRLGWSRYMSQAEGDALRAALEAVSCDE